MTLDLLERPKSATIEAKLLFLERSGGKPLVSFRSGAAVGETDALYVPRSVTLHNMREADPSLDNEGFTLVRHRTAVRDFYDDSQVETGRVEAAQIVARATGAAYVHVFDHTLRRRAPDAPRQPSVRVHNDYTAASAPRRVRDLFGDQADDLLSRRVAFINVWRPIRHPAIDWPLALCDARTVAPGDLVATDIAYKDRVGEIYALTQAPRQRWSYAPAMQLDETLLIKCYDSAPDVARFTPHTAFDNPLAPAGTPPRESIEFRTIAFYD